MIDTSSIRRPLLQQINLVCGDLDASLAFYRKLGVEVPDDGVWRTSSGAHHARATASSVDGSVDFAFDSVVHAWAWNSGWKGRSNVGGRVFVGFGVAARSDVDALFHEMLDAGYRGLQEPWDAHWGARFAIIEDPDGIAVGVMSPISADKKSPPPEL